MRRNANASSVDLFSEKLKRAEMWARKREQLLMRAIQILCAFVLNWCGYNILLLFQFKTNQKTVENTYQQCFMRVCSHPHASKIHKITQKFCFQPQNHKTIIKQQQISYMVEWRKNSFICGEYEKLWNNNKNRSATRQTQWIKLNRFVCNAVCDAIYENLALGSGQPHELANKMLLSKSVPYREKTKIAKTKDYEISLCTENGENGNEFCSGQLCSFVPNQFLLPSFRMASQQFNSIPKPIFIFNFWPKIFNVNSDWTMISWENLLWLLCSFNEIYLCNKHK